MKKDEEILYNLKLHEVMQREDFQALRVPGGWIYRYWDYEKRDYYADSTFVPYSEEFLPRNPEHIGIAQDEPTNIKAGD